MPDPRTRILCMRSRLDPANPSTAVPDEDWVEALAHQADVTVIEQDFDLAAICGRDRPDLIVLASLDQARPWPVTVANPLACPEIPRVLFVTGEPWNPLRTLTMRWADTLGVETIFLPGEAHRQHMPDLLHRWCHYAPFSIDDAVYAESDAAKTVPVSLFDGNVEPGLHPWRSGLAAALQLTVPTLSYDRSDADNGPAPFRLTRDAQARLIGESWFAVFDPGRFDHVSEDALRIAAAGAVLVGPESPALQAYGFRNGENCLLGPAPDLPNRIDQLSRDPERYARVRDAGRALVLSRCGRAAWRPLLDWLACRSRLKPGQVVQQIGLYGPFRGVTPTFATPSVLTTPSQPNAIAAVLKQAQAAILNGSGLLRTLDDLDAATRWSPAVGETLFLFSILALLNGNAVEAAMGMGSRAERLGAIGEELAAFDPLEAAWLMLVARLVGHEPLETAMRDQARSLRHVSLRRMLWLLDGGDLSLDESLLARAPDDQLTVHWLGDEDFTVWADLVRRVLKANAAAPGMPSVSRRLLAAA